MVKKLRISPHFEIKKELFKTQTHCVYCNGKMQFQHPWEMNYATVDHIEPSSLGGQDTIDNFVLACKLCNTLKSDKYEFNGFKVNDPENIVAYTNISKFINILVEKPLLSKLIPIIETYDLPHVLEYLDNDNSLLNRSSFKTKLVTKIHQIISQNDSIILQWKLTKALLFQRQASYEKMMSDLGPIPPITLYSFKIINKKIIEEVIV